MKFKNLKCVEHVVEALESKDWENLYVCAEEYLRSYMLDLLHKKSSESSLEQLYCECVRKGGAVCSCSAIHALQSKDYTLRDSVIKAVHNLLMADCVAYLRSDLGFLFVR